MVNADDRGRGIGCMISRRLIWRTLDARRQPVGWLSRHLGRCAACSAYWRGARRLEAALRLPIPQEVVGPVVSAKICRGPRLVYRVAAAGALAACVAVLVMMLG